MSIPPVNRSFPAESVVPLNWQPGDLILDTYEVKQVFTGGALANVYAVHHREWDLDLAVKSPRLPEGQSLSGRLAYYVREAETWVKLGLHPNIVACYYIRLLGGIPRVFMEFVDGPSLVEAIESGRLYSGEKQAVLLRMIDIAIQFAWGLDYAHGKGLVHQDVKPANLLLAPGWIAKVSDFGMAQAGSVLQSGTSQPAAGLELGDERSLLVGTTGFTPAYCSPEQAAGHPLTRRTDVWSWALSVLQMFWGEKPWKAGSEALRALDRYLQAGPSCAGIPPMPVTLVEVLRECFALDPEARPHDMNLLAVALKDIYAQIAGQGYPRFEPHLETLPADTINNRAVSLIDLGKTTEALELLEEALQAETTHPAALYNRSLLLWRSSRLTDEDVLEVLEENNKVLPDPRESTYTLGLVHLERGDRDGALAAAGQIHRSSSESANHPFSRRLSEGTHRLGSYASRCLRVYPASEGRSITSAALSADGRFLLAGGSDACLGLFATDSGNCLRHLAGHSTRIQAVALAPEGRLALSGSWDGEVRLWDLASGQSLHRLEGHSDYITSLAFLPGRRVALSASGDGSLRTWDLASGECTHTIAGHLDAVSAAIPLPGGRFVVSASFDNTLRIWDLASGRCLAVFPWNLGCTSNLAISSDGRRLLLGGGNHQVWLVDLTNGQPLHAFPGHRGAIKAVQFAAGERQALSAGLDGTLRIWDLESGRCLRTFFGHSGAVNALAAPQDKGFVFSGGSDGALRLWLLGRSETAPYLPVLPRSSQELLERSQEVKTQVETARRKAADGDYKGAMALIAAVRLQGEHSQDPGLVDLWDTIGQRGWRCGLRSAWIVKRFQPHPDRTNTLAFAGDFLLTGGEAGDLRLWDLKSGQALQRFAGHRGRVCSVAVAPGPGLALSGGQDGALRLWDIVRGNCLQVLPGHANSVNSVSISGDGKRGLSGSSDNTVRLWDLEAGKSLQVFTGHTHAVRSTIIVPGERLGLSAGLDKTLQVWDLERCISRYRLGDHNEVIDALALSPDGHTAASGGINGDIRFWDLRSGTAQGLIPNQPAYIRALVFSEDGRFIFSGDQFGRVRLWELAGARCIYSFDSHAGNLLALALSPEGRFLVSSGSSGLLSVWRLDWDYSFDPLPVN